MSAPSQPASSADGTTAGSTLLAGRVIAAQPEIRRPARSFLSSSLRRFARDWVSVGASILFLLIVLVTVFAPVIASTNCCWYTGRSGVRSACTSMPCCIAVSG